MLIQPHPYKIKSKDLKEILALGYSSSGGSLTEIKDFINQYFPNFNLKKLLGIIEVKFAPTSQTEIKRELIVDFKKITLTIDFRNQFYGEEDALIFIRKFWNDFGNISVFHEYCIIPAPFRNAGIVKPVFLESLVQYVNMDAKKIFVHAGLGMGGYVWAKYGFHAAQKSQMESNLKKASKVLTSKQYLFVENIFLQYYSKNP